MKKKILFSTKFCANDNSDVVGGSLPHIVFAEFFKKNFNYTVDLYDPFYNSKNLLNKFCDNVYEDLPKNLNSYHKIINPLFYVTNIKKRNDKIISLEGASLKQKNKVLFERVSNLTLEQKRFGLESLIIPSIKGSFGYKNLDIPYLYYYEWLARESFVSNLSLKKSNKLKIPKNKNIYSIHIRYTGLNKKKSYLAETQIEKENYEDFIINLVKKIKKEDRNSYIIVYGLEPNEKPFLKVLIKLGCLHLERLSNNPLERSLLLAINNISIATVNGFTDFTNFLSFSKNNLKRKIIYNDGKNVDEIIHSRRHLEKGISEKKLSKNSYFYKKFEFFTKDSVLLKTNFNKKSKNILNIKTKKPKYIIVYKSSEINNFYFSKTYDDIILEHFLENYSTELKKYKIVIRGNGNFYKHKINNKIKLTNEDLSKNQHLLTHYRLKSKDKNFLLKGSIDFTKPKFFKELVEKNKINPSNILYNDIYSHFIEHSLKDQIIKKKMKKILIIDNPNSQIKKNLDWNDFISKINQENKKIYHFMYTQNDRSFKITNKKELLKINYSNLKNLLEKFDTIICRPNLLSFFVNFIFSKNKNIIFYSTEGKNNYVVDPENFLFSSDFKYKTMDLYKTRIQHLGELTLYLSNKNVNF